MESLSIDSQASADETTVYRQALKNGAVAGPPVPALKMAFALREDYNGNDYTVSLDLATVVFARPNGHQDLYFLSQK